jgi:hypothetical protein
LFSHQLRDLQEIDMATATAGLTMGDVSTRISKRFRVVVPIWKLRRVVDDLENAGLLDVTRIGNYRTIDEAGIDAVVSELQRLEWLPNR